MRFDDPAWRRSPLRTTARVAESLLRRRLAPEAIAPFDGGRARVHADLHTALGLQLFRYGIWDADLALVAALLRPGDVFIDGGANVGLFSLVAASRVAPTGRVIAYEPAPATASMLRRNLELNQARVEVHQAALGDTAGTLEFAALPGDGAGTSRLSDQPVPGAQMLQVPVERLDELSFEVGFAGAVLLKLDLEGAELGALHGAEALFEVQQPDVLIELIEDQLASFGASAAEVTGFLTARGYRLFETGLDAAGPTLAPASRQVGSAAAPNLFATRDLERIRSLGVRISS